MTQNALNSLFVGGANILSQVCVLMRTVRAGLLLRFLLVGFVVLVAENSLLTGQAAVPQDFDELSRQAEAARAQGNSEEAIRDYEAALKIRAEWPEGWWYLGTLYAEAGRFTDAIPVFRKLTDANPKLGPAWASLGLSEFALKNYPDSLTHLRQAQELGFAEVPYLEKAATYHLALLLNLNGEFEDAFGLLASKSGKDGLAQQTRIALAMSLLRIPLLPDQLDPSKDALIADAGEAAEMLISANFDQAFQAFRQMLQDYPDTPFLHYAYGSALDFSSKYDEAEVQLREETAVSPQSALPYMRLAAVALKAKRPAVALPSAERAIKLAPQSATAHKIMAKILTELGKTEPAAKENEIVEKLGPEKPEIDRNVLTFYTHGVPNSETIASKTNAGATTGEFDDVVRQAKAAEQAGHSEEAIERYQSALKLRPTWDEGWSNAGMLFYITGRPTEGILALKNALGINPRRAEAWVFLGLCEFQKKEYKNAYLHLERGREREFHGTPQAQQLASLRLAELRNWRGEFDGAKELLIPEVDRGQLTATTKSILGLGLLRLPLLLDQIDPSHEALVHAAGEAAALLYAERYNEAFQAFEQMLKDFPHTQFLHYAYGSALESLSQHDEAEAQLREELKLDPDSALSYMRLAAIALKTGRSEDAVSDAERAVKLDPRSPGGHELLGRALLESGKAEAAVKELETASQLAPNYPEVHFNLARAYSKARMPTEAERERAIFAELSEAEEQLKTSQDGSPAFMTPYQRKRPASSEFTAAPEARPK